MTPPNPAAHRNNSNNNSYLVESGLHHLKLSPEKLTQANMTVHERVELMASQSLNKGDPILASHGLNDSSSVGYGLFSAFKQHRLNT